MVDYLDKLKLMKQVLYIIAHFKFWLSSSMCMDLYVHVTSNAPQPFSPDMFTQPIFLERLYHDLRNLIDPTIFLESINP